MRSSYSSLMQSKFYNPAFNSAIFDGPIRIYFAQFHEALALKIYFMLQQELSEELLGAKELSKTTGANILLLIYPTTESYEASFEGSAGRKGQFHTTTWNEDLVIGTRGPVGDENLEELLALIKTSINNWSPGIASPVLELQEL